MLDSSVDSKSGIHIDQEVDVIAVTCQLPDLRTSFVGNLEAKIKEVSDFHGRFSDLDKMSDFYRCAYHPTLGHFYGQAKKMKSSPTWQDTRKMPIGAERKTAFQKFRENLFLEKK